MPYFPPVESCNPIARVKLGDDHVAICYDTIVSAGLVQYTFLLGVFRNDSHQPVYFVASEVNGMAESLGGGSHFLCVFNGRSHGNMGASDDWGDPAKFFPKAIEIAAKHFGVEDAGQDPRLN